MSGRAAAGLRRIARRKASLPFPVSPLEQYFAPRSRLWIERFRRIA